MQPAHVIAAKFRTSKTHLNENAKIAINWHGYTSNTIGQGTAVLHNTLLKSGFNVKFYSDSQDENHRNVIILASLSALPEYKNEIQPTLMLKKEPIATICSYSKRQMLLLI